MSTTARLILETKKIAYDVRKGSLVTADRHVPPLASSFRWLIAGSLMTDMISDPYEPSTIMSDERSSESPLGESRV